MPRVGLIVNDGKDLAVTTADRIEARFRAAGRDVLRVSSSGGMVGFANPDQHLRTRGYAACVPPSFDPELELAVVLGGDGTVLSAARQTAPIGVPILTINTGPDRGSDSHDQHRPPGLPGGGLSAPAGSGAGSADQRRLVGGGAHNADRERDARRAAALGGALPQRDGTAS